MKTYYKFYRSIVDHDLLSNDNNAYIVFTKLLARVNWKTGTLRTGRFKMAALTNLPPSTVYKALKRLEGNSIVTLTGTAKYTDITVVNWAKYQGEGTGEGTAKEQPGNTINKNKRIKESIITQKNDLTEKMISSWETYLGMELTSRPSQERAARSIIRRIGEEKALGAVISAISCQNDQYAPHIANLVQLDKKLDSLLIYKRKQKKDLNNNLVVPELENPKRNVLTDEERKRAGEKLSSIKKDFLNKRKDKL